MGFDIPMRTSGAMDSSSLLSLNGGGQVQTPQHSGTGDINNAGYNYDQPTNTPPMSQPQMGGYGQQPQINQYNQQPPMGQPQMGQTQMGQPPMGQPPMGQTQMGQYNQQPPMGQTQMGQSPVGQPKQRPTGNGVRLKKGQKFGLAGANGAPMLNLKVALGWDILNQNCDLDSSAFMLGNDGKVLGDDWFVFYGSTTSPDGAVIHSGDSGGAGEGDDEVISVNLQRINPQVEKIVFVVTINEALERQLNFSMVANAYIRIVNSDTNQEIARFDLTNYYSNVTSMMVGELYKRNGEWKFNPIGDGISADLLGLCQRYGVNVADE